MEDTEKINYHDATFVDGNGIQQAVRIPVVQDLSRLKTLPRNFIRNPDAAHPFPSDTCFEAIDMGRLRSKSDRVTELRKLGSTCTEWGMFMIQNHGLDPGVLEEVEQVVGGFFKLPFEEKKLSVGTYMSTDNLGYGRNLVRSEAQPLDWIDRLAMKAAPAAATDGLRVWPNNPPNFRPTMEKYVKACRELLNELLEALAQAVSLDSQSFSRYFDPETSEINIRINYYPSCPKPDLTLGLIQHSDASVLTLLNQFRSSNGLQVFKEGHWITMPWPCNTLLINLGDFIEIMSNGRLKSSWHRAVAQLDTDRASIALFYNPPTQVEIEPVEDGEPIKYKKIVLEEYLKQFHKSSAPTIKGFLRNLLLE